MQTTPPPIELDEARLREHYLTFTETQKKFLNLTVRWCLKPRRKILVVISGGPGTGKTYVVKNTLDCVKTSQLRMSYTARSAQAIDGKTIHSAVNLNFKGLCLDLEKQLADEENLRSTIKASGDIVNEFTFNEYPSIIVVDEVSMINGWLMYWLIRFFMDRTETPLLFIAIGDPHQLNPVKSIHNLFSFTFNESRWKVEIIHLKESKRFLPEYETIINQLRQCVDAGDESGLFGLLCEHFPIYDTIDGPLLVQANRAMAFKNDRVNKYNQYYIKNMVQGPEIVIDNYLILKPGCIVFVTKNGCSSVSNGTELKFERFNETEEVVICRHPKTNKKVIVRKDFLTKRFPIALGFAATIHKFQGETIDDAKLVIHFDGSTNLNMVYTAVSRVRHMDQILAIAL